MSRKIGSEAHCRRFKVQSNLPLVVLIPNSKITLLPGLPIALRLRPWPQCSRYIPKSRFSLSSRLDMPSQTIIGRPPGLSHVVCVPIRTRLVFDAEQSLFVPTDTSGEPVVVGAENRSWQCTSLEHMPSDSRPNRTVPATASPSARRTYP